MDVLECLQTLRAAVPWSVSCCNVAARAGRIDLMMWLRHLEPPCPWSEATMELAISGDERSVAIVQWLRAQDQDPPCPWNASVCEAAARNANIPALTWLRAQNPPCTWGAATCMNAAGLLGLRH